jgi:hypothetical protein
MKFLILVLMFVFYQSLQFNLQTELIHAEIPWPFNICATGKWSIESVTFDSLPVRNAFDEI